MKIKITTLPDDLVKNVTYKNWKNIWKTSMIYEDEYVWSPSVMKEFIENIVKSMKFDIGR